MGPNTSACPKYSSVFRSDTHIWGFKDPPICVSLLVQTPHIMLKEEKQTFPQQLFRCAPDSFLTHRKYQFCVYTGHRKAHLYSTRNYSTHNIIAVITKYGTWQHLWKVGSVYSVDSGNALKT